MNPEEKLAQDNTVFGHRNAYPPSPKERRLIRRRIKRIMQIERFASDAFDTQPSTDFHQTYERIPVCLIICENRHILETFREIVIVSGHRFEEILLIDHYDLRLLQSFKFDFIIATDHDTVSEIRAFDAETPLFVLDSGYRPHQPWKIGVRTFKNAELLDLARPDDLREKLGSTLQKLAKSDSRDGYFAHRISL